MLYMKRKDSYQYFRQWFYLASYRVEVLKCGLQFKLSTHSLQRILMSPLAEFPFSTKIVHDYTQLCVRFTYVWT